MHALMDDNAQQNSDAKN